MGGATPRVSIVVPLYNDAAFIGAAIDSLLAQTLTDFELIVVDDASTDDSRAIVASYGDPRLRLLTNEANLGGAATRNRGLAEAKGDYVAFLDANDIALPLRLDEQARFLDENRDVALVGCQAVLIDVTGKRIGEFWRPTTRAGIRWCGIFQSPVVHSSVMARRSILWTELGGYNAALRFGEDFDMWRRVARNHRIANLPQALVAYRVDPASMTGTSGTPSRAGYRERKTEAILSDLRDILNTNDVTRNEVDSWLALGEANCSPSREQLHAAVSMIETCAARFTALFGEDRDVARHAATMLARVVERSHAVGRVVPLRLWMKLWARDRRLALAALPRFVPLLVLGEWPLAIRRALRRRASRRARETSISR